MPGNYAETEENRVKDRHSNVLTSCTGTNFLGGDLTTATSK